MRCDKKSTWYIRIGSYGGGWCLCLEHAQTLLKQTAADPEMAHLEVRQRELKDDDPVLMTAAAEHYQRRVCQWDQDIHEKVQPLP